MRVRQHNGPHSRIAFMSEFRRRYRGELVNAARRAFTGPAEVIPLRSIVRAGEPDNMRLGRDEMAVQS